jgi:hypothetical protein
MAWMSLLAWLMVVIPGPVGAAAVVPTEGDVKTARAIDAAQPPTDNATAMPTVALPAAVDRVALGAYIPGAPSDPSAIDRFARQVGVMPRNVMWYQMWSGAWNDFYARGANAILARGAMPMITWEPWTGGGSLDNPRWSLRAILRGDHDAYIRSWTRAVARWGRPLYVRPMHEMNGDWTPWSPGVNGNTAAQFRSAWRHIVTIARNQGADNIRWVWCPNVAYPGSTPFASVWPGPGYVDWMCLDGYNWGTTQQNSSWRSLRSTFGPSVSALASLSAKPIMVGETASSEHGGSKAAWILNGFNALPEVMPRIRAVVWFNKAQDGADWPIGTSSASLQAFRTVAALPVYAGRLP